MDIGCGDGDGLVLAGLCTDQSSLWGMDLDLSSLKKVSARVPSARLLASRMPGQTGVRSGQFDLVHEFGMAYLIDDWGALARDYMSLAREDGVILWELPRKWSIAHLMFLLALAPKQTEKESRIRRLFRSLAPGKFFFPSDGEIRRFLDRAGSDYEILEEVPIWYFYCGGPFRELSTHCIASQGPRPSTSCTR
jgi:hypothetical protein